MTAVSIASFGPALDWLNRESPASLKEVWDRYPGADLIVWMLRQHATFHAVGSYSHRRATRAAAVCVLQCKPFWPAPICAEVFDQIYAFSEGERIDEQAFRDKVYSLYQVFVTANQRALVDGPEVSRSNVQAFCELSAVTALYCLSHKIEYLTPVTVGDIDSAAQALGLSLLSQRDGPLHHDHVVQARDSAKIHLAGIVRQHVPFLEEDNERTAP